MHSRQRMTKIAWLPFVVLMLLAAVSCQSPPTAPSPTQPPVETIAENPTGVAPVTVTNEARSETPVAPTAEPPAPPQPAATPQESPTPLPSPTLPPAPQPVTLLVPAPWQTVVEEALGQYSTNDSAVWAWHIVSPDDPAADSAQVTVQEGDSGILIARDPTVLAVGFTTDWSELSRAEAEAILADGHALVTVMDWSAMNPRFKALRVDGLHPTDDSYPFQGSWSLAAKAGYEAAAADLAPILEVAATKPIIHLAAVGDIMLDRTLGEFLVAGNLTHPFAEVAPVLQAADFTIGNLETALGTVGEPADKQFSFRSPPQAAESLARAGFDLVSLANNHAQDYGPDALLQAIDLLADQAIFASGAGKDETAAYAPQIEEIQGLTVGFLSYVNVPIEGGTNFDTQTWAATAESPGLAWGEPDRIRSDVATIRSEVDLVIVQLHSGYEYIEEPGEVQAAAAAAAIEGGADLVIGHHAHLLQGVRFEESGVIAYGLGNFAFDIDGPPETAVLNVWLDENGVRQLEYLPAIVQEWGQPRFADETEAAAIHQRLNFLTMLLNPVPAGQ